jgi:mono/diheme cytochrome c family protein
MRLMMIWFGLAFLVAACAVNEMPEAPEGRALFVENCAQCHQGDAKGGKEWPPALGRAPPDLTGLYARGFDRASVLSTIDGFTRAPLEGHEMPDFGLFLGGETVPIEVDGVLTPVPRKLAALFIYLESVQVE